MLKSRRAPYGGAFVIYISKLYKMDGIASKFKSKRTLADPRDLEAKRKAEERKAEERKEICPKAGRQDSMPRRRQR